MPFEFRVNGRIDRPVAQVFDAVVNPDQLSRYFVTLGGISGPLVAGATVKWWGQVPVQVEAVEQNERIVFRWDAMVAKGEEPYQTRVEMRFQSLDDGATMVRSPKRDGVRTGRGRRGLMSTAKAGRRCLPA